MLQLFFFFLKQKTAYDMRISDWSSDVCSSDLKGGRDLQPRIIGTARALPRIGPAVVEDIFALAVRLQISGRRRDQCARSILDQQRRRLPAGARPDARSEEQTSELPSLMRNSYAVFCLKKQPTKQQKPTH